MGKEEKILKGNPFGTHRVIKPCGSLPQAALKLDNDFRKIYDNEILCRVSRLNIDSASFLEIKRRAGGSEEEIGQIMRGIVAEAGKHKNPWTGSGGVFTGVVSRVGSALKGRVDITEGDRVVSLVSLSLTPLKIDEILKVNKEIGVVDIKGEAVLFETGVWAKLPDSLPEVLSLAVCDVAGAPAQAHRLVSPGDVVAVLGAAGKSGLLSCYQAKKRCGEGGRVIGVIHKSAQIAELSGAEFIDELIVCPAERATLLFEKVGEATGGGLCDIVISCVSRPECEMGAIMIAKEGGKICFFSMATSFTRAALGAEGIGKDVEMIIGNGYVRGHAEMALGAVSESRFLRELFEKRYC